MEAQEITERIDGLITAEIAGMDSAARADRILIADFQALRESSPSEIEVQFSGGIRQTCWRVTRSNGAYSVVFIPMVGYFSLCADSAIGLLDIGVHGPALRCFSSV